MIAWQLQSGVANAEEGETGKSSENWFDGTAEFIIPFEVPHDDLTTALRTTLVNNGVTGSWVSSDSALKTHLGWTAGQTTQKSFKQTVKWEEKLSKPDGTGEKPNKFRRLKWEYGGNHLIDVVISADGQNVGLTNGKNVGMVLFVEGFIPTDIFQLGDYTLSPTASGIGSGDVTLLGGPQAGGASQWYPSGNTGTEQPGDKAMAQFGTWSQNYAAQPKLVNTVGDWAGNNDGVGSLELRHTTNCLAFIVIRDPSGNISVPLPFALQIQPNKKATVTTTDWKNDRNPQTMDGVYTGNLWEIHIKRPD